MKTFLVMYDNPDWKEEKPFNSKVYDSSLQRKGYEACFRIGKKYGFDFARACCKWHKGKGVFSKAWVYDGKWHKKTNIKADVVLDKTPGIEKFAKIKKEIAKHAVMINHPELDRICSDKQATFRMFKSIVPKSFLVHSKKELKRALPKIRTEKVVVKPAFGSSAYGVEIVEKGKIPAKISRNTIVQEMIDASKGVPGITRGVADLRVTIINGKIMHPYVRKAAKGSLFSNVSRGAKMIFAKKIPKSALEISKKIDKRLSKFKNRIYTIDIMFDQNSKPWVIELNSKPGFVGHYQFKGSKAVDAAYHEIFKGLTAKKRSRKP